MLAGIEENGLKTGKHKVKVKYFPGARTHDMYDYMKALLWKLPDYVILYIDNTNAFDNTSREIFEKILKLKMYIRKELLKCKTTISTPIKRHDHGKASPTISHFSQKFNNLYISFAYNSSIGAFSLRSGGLHLNDKDLGRLAINLKLKICKLPYKLDPMNDHDDKKMLDESTSNFQGRRV